VFSVTANAYFDARPTTHAVAARSETAITRSLSSSGRWYDFSVRVVGQADYSRRVAGRLENGAPSVSDPAMQGVAVGEQYRPAG
jgi:phospholipase C